MFGFSLSFFWGIFIYLSGIASVLISVWYWITIQENDHSFSIRKHSLHETKLPECIENLVQNPDSYKQKETCVALNLLLQFFFQERRYDLNITKWLTNLLTQEFTELLRHRTLSKIINKMQIQHLNLGNNFPVIKSVTPLNVQFVKESTLLKNIEVSIDVEYTGGFQIAIDAITKLSKKAMVKIKVVRLSGKGCLELSRYPFSHWSFSFYEEPESEFEVDSSVLGRQIPRFKAIIINQLRNLLKKKHTLPYYKLRAAPLVNRPLHKVGTQLSEGEDADEVDESMSGILDVSLVRCSRLQPCLVKSTMYFSLTLSEAPLVCAYETAVGIWMVQDVVVTKIPCIPIGILLRTADDSSQIIETVSGRSSASVAGLRKNDIILAVNGVPLVSGTQAAKLLTSSSSSSSLSTSSSSTASFSPSSFRKGGGERSTNNSSQVLIIRVKRLMYTDHKRGSGESPPLDDGGFLPRVPQDDASFDSATLGTRSSTSFSTGKGNRSDPSTPDSSRSNSPELRSPCNASDEKPLTENCSSSLFPLAEYSAIASWSRRGSENLSWKGAVDGCTSVLRQPSPPSAPIQVPTNTSCDDSSLLLLQENSNKSSISPNTSSGKQFGFTSYLSIKPQSWSPSNNWNKHSSSQSNPKEEGSSSMQENSPGAPALKMDAKGSSKKTPSRTRPLIKHYETSHVEGDCDPVIGNEFTFYLNDESKYLNICVWSKKNMKSMDDKGEEKLENNKEDDKRGIAKEFDKEMDDKEESCKKLERELGKHLINVKEMNILNKTSSKDKFPTNVKESDRLNSKTSSKDKLLTNLKDTDRSDNKTSSRVMNRFRRREVKSSENEAEKKTWVKESSPGSSAETQNLPMTGHPDHTLVGLTNISIEELIPATRWNTQGNATKVFDLESADPACPEVLQHPLHPHKGFDPSLCYGDVMLSVTHQPLDKCDSRPHGGAVPLGSPGEDEYLTDATLSEEEDGNHDEEKDHTFRRTHFSSATQCTFCKKKIWLKDAYQCTECGVICHKKCMLRCQQATVCDYGGLLRYREIRDPPPREELGHGAGPSKVISPTPEIVVPPLSPMVASSVLFVDGKKTPPSSPMSPRHTLSSFLSNIAAPVGGPLKRTGSAHCLTPPLHGSEMGFSRSLPPSPQHSPRPSRKSSLTGNPFITDDEVEGVNHMEIVLEKLIAWPHDDQLVSLARETSHQLYAHLPPKEREVKIKEELDELQVKVNREGETRVVLAQQEKEATEKKDPIKRTKLALLISKCDSRTQALALLTMHYFNALQTVQLPSDA